MKNLNVVVYVITDFDIDDYEVMNLEESFRATMNLFDERDFCTNGEKEYLEKLLGSFISADANFNSEVEFMENNSINALVSRSYGTMEIIVKTTRLARKLAVFFNKEADENLVGFNEIATVNFFSNLDEPKFFEWAVDSELDQIHKLIDIVNSMAPDEGSKIEQIESGNEFNLSFITECEKSTNRFKGMIEALIS